MVIRISKNFCHIEIEVAEPTPDYVPDATYLQQLYDCLPGGEPGNKATGTPSPKAAAGRVSAKSRPTPDDVPPVFATSRQIAKLEEFDYPIKPGLTKADASAILTRLGVR